MASLGLLAACDSGDSGAGDPFAAHDGRLADVAALGVTPFQQLPQTGAVAYAGSAILNLPIGELPVPYLANMTATVEFENGDVTGTFDGFQSSDQGNLDGVLTINDGAFDPGADPSLDYQFTAAVAGTLTDGTEFFTIDGALAGDFRGPDGTAMAGVVYGDITSNGMVDIFDGAFVAISAP